MKKTAVLEWYAWKFSAMYAMHILAMFFLMAPALAACGSAPTPPASSALVNEVEPIGERTDSMRLATFGGGCFWCTEAIFLNIKGVEKVVSGYSGGNIANPTYREVSSGKTGHAEVIQITYNPNMVDYADLLRVFFGTHDPTTLNRQGADVGTQYRSVIFYHDQEQHNTAREIINEAQEYLEDPIVTVIEAYKAFYPAEDYHQDYYNNNKSQGYCQFVIAPKLKKLREKYSEYLK